MTSNPRDELEIRDEVTAYDILVPIWRYRSLTMVLMVLGLIIAIIYQFVAVPRYTARITIAPLPSDLTLSQTGANLPGLSLLANAAGGGGAGPDDFGTFTFLLQSPLIAKNLEKDYHVKKFVYSRFWNASTQQWSGEKENFLIKLFRVVVNAPWTPPSDADFAKYLGHMIVATPNGSFTVLSYEFSNRAVAKTILGGAVAEAQKVIRDAQHRRADAALAFLNQQLATMPSTMAQQALIALSIQWEQKKLLAQNNLDVGVDIIEPLTVSDKRTSPSPTIDILTGVFGSAALGIMISVILGLFVSDDPARVREWVVGSAGAFAYRFKRLFGRTSYRLER